MRQVYPSFIDYEIIGIQPMTNLVPMKKHWKIIEVNGKWELWREWYDASTLITQTDIFDSKSEAINVMMLEKLEQ
jgi:hypothetical protein